MIHTHTYIYINTYTERDRGEPELAFVLSREPLQTAECELGMDPSSGRRWHLRRGQRHRQRAADCAVTWLNAKSDAADEIMATAGSWTLLEGRSVCLYVYMYIYIHIHIHIYIYIYNGLTLSAVASLGIRVAGRARLQVYSARAAASSAVAPLGIREGGRAQLQVYRARAAASSAVAPLEIREGGRARRQVHSTAAASSVCYCRKEAALSLTCAVTHRAASIVLYGVLWCICSM